MGQQPHLSSPLYFAPRRGSRKPFAVASRHWQTVHLSNTHHQSSDPAGVHLWQGGLLSTVWQTVLHAFGRVGSLDITSNEWLNALHEDQPAEHRRTILWSRILLVFHGTVFMQAFVAGLWVLPVIFTLFNFTANWLAYLLGLPQHCGLQENVADFCKSMWSITLNPVFEFLYWHMNWHTEHHMYAGVPCYNLKKLYQAVRDDMP